MNPIECREQVSLQALNTFGLPGVARHYAHLQDEAQLPGLLAQPVWQQSPRVVLGGGSNVLLQGDVDALVLHVGLQGRRLLEAGEAGYLVEAAAGENWHEFVRWTLAQGWGGLENLSLIPGTVGAAPVQNIGAYGLELEARLHSVVALDLQCGEWCCLERSACAFAYRDSVFKRQPGRYLITRVRFLLPARWQPVRSYAELDRALPDMPTPLQVSDAVTAIRRAKLPDPSVLGNAGSFFKNPVVDAGQGAALRARWPGMPAYPQPDGQIKLAAGWLIEQSGWKGRTLGAAGVYERQALVLVNRGGASGAEVLALAAAIIGDVQERFGVELEMEPVRIGRPAAWEGSV